MCVLSGIEPPETPTSKLWLANTDELYVTTTTKAVMPAATPKKFGFVILNGNVSPV
jgi:hypothetical protein